MYIFADDRHAGRWGMREPLSQAGIIMISARDPPNAWLTVEKSGHWDIEVFFSCPRHFYRWPLVTHSLTQWVGDVLIPESAELSLRQSENDNTTIRLIRRWLIITRCEQLIFPTLSCSRQGSGRHNNDEWSSRCQWRLSLERLGLGWAGGYSYPLSTSLPLI